MSQLEPAEMPERDRNWIGEALRKLRLAAGWSLATFEQVSGVPAVVMGSYERGDRAASVFKVDEILRFFGKQLAVADLVETDPDASRPVRTLVEVAAELENIAAALRRAAP